MSVDTAVGVSLTIIDTIQILVVIGVIGVVIERLCYFFMSPQQRIECDKKSDDFKDKILRKSVLKELTHDYVVVTGVSDDDLIKRVSIAMEYGYTPVGSIERPILGLSFKQSMMKV
jgi:uncharacterized membrane protein YbaN (DUF454 family)